MQRKHPFWNLCKRLSIARENLIWAMLFKEPFDVKQSKTS